MTFLKFAMQQGVPLSMIPPEVIRGTNPRIFKGGGRGRTIGKCAEAAQEFYNYPISR